MTTYLWRIATDTSEYTADNMQGLGAKISGGRWNRRGTPMVYASMTRALACLETMVHLATGGLPLNRYLVQIAVPDDLWNARRVITATDADVGWDALPAGRVSLDTGDDWCRARGSLLLCVPSIVVPEELNVLINPAHPGIKQLIAIKTRKWLYDARVWP
jgi:RES domain-containing protein